MKNQINMFLYIISTIIYLFFVFVGFIGILQYNDYPEAINSMLKCCTFFIVGSLGLSINLLIHNINRQNQN